MRIVFKFGTSTLTNRTNHLSHPRMVDLARQIATLRAAGHEIIVVSSGAIAVGRERLQYPQLPKSIPAKQMLAAVGQPGLIERWTAYFAIYDVLVAQVLLTKGDIRSRRSYLNARNTLLSLLSHQVLPVVNENDTVATAEIRFGDNDNLSALVANLVDADLLVLLTDQEGLFTTDPRVDPTAQLVQTVESAEIPQALWASAGGSGQLGSGGMFTKLQSADLARRSGTRVVIARGDLPEILIRVANGETVGTSFSPVGSAVESRKRYILSGGEAGGLEVDDGAAKALRQGRSLLPAGVTVVRGDFDRGETVSVLNREGVEIARGLVNYDAVDCRRLCGSHSSAIENLLGYDYGEEIIHRNDMVMLK